MKYLLLLAMCLIPLVSVANTVSASQDSYVNLNQFSANYGTNNFKFFYLRL
jgi:hypothetical protein